MGRQKIVKRLKEQRLHPWPAILETEEGWLIKVNILTPWRMTLFHEFVRKPLIALWKGSVVFLVIDLLLQLVGNASWIAWFFPWTYDRQLAVVVCCYLLHLFELNSQGLVARSLIGASLQISVDQEKMKIRSTNSCREMDLERPVAFGLSPLSDVKEPLYRHAYCLFVVLDDKSRFRIAEVYGTSDAEALVSNLNFLISHRRAEQERDLDPRFQTD